MTDIAKGQKQKIESLRQSEILREGHVYTIGDFCDKSEADIEDLISDDLFVQIVNEAFHLPDEHKLTTATLIAANTSTERNVLRAESFFNLLPESIPIFDHFTPSNWLLHNIAVIDADLDEQSRFNTLDRFEKVFKTFNELL